MGGLLSALGNTGSALNVIEQALSVIQNNVSNSSTPGYASQAPNLTAQPFDVATGAAGGVAEQGLISSRDSWADTQVQLQLQNLGLYTAQNQSTGTIQGLFDASGNSGVSSALSSLFNAFSAWSASPTDTVAEQTVITAASTFAGAVNSLSSSLDTTAQQLNGQISSTVSQINTLASQVQQYNASKLQNSTPDPGADANLESTLESLSQLTNFTALTQPDGTVTLLVGGGTPLVIGSQQYQLSASDFVNNNPPATNPQSLPTAHVLDSQGNDITADITGGQLGGLLDSRNRVLSSIIGDFSADRNAESICIVVRRYGQQHSHVGYGFDISGRGGGSTTVHLQLFRCHARRRISGGKPCDHAGRTRACRFERQRERQCECFGYTGQSDEHTDVAWRRGLYFVLCRNRSVCGSAEFDSPDQSNGSATGGFSGAVATGFDFRCISG